MRIDTDKLTDPRWNRVFPILEEEQIVMCRNMAQRGIFAPGRQVLDIGTGSGVLAIYAATHGCKVVAIDQCPRAARSAEHNLRHSCNQRKIQEAGGEVSRPKTISIKDFAASDLNNGKFDVILLNPPFNPTAPELPAASHAAAGPDGNECLTQQLPHAFRLVSRSGVIAGVQMFLHDADQGVDWWKARLDEAIASQKDAFAAFHITMVYSPLVETEAIDARTFLSAQYEHFLNPHLRLFPDDVMIRRYIDEFAPKDAGRQFSYVYYEIRIGNRAAGKPLEPAITRIPQIFPSDTHGRTWKDRLVLHRAIVEHTSLHHSVPVPALFLENDFTPALPKPACPLESRRPEGRDLYDQSPLSSALRWIVQARMFSKEVGFDKILIDVGPWFDSWEGRRALHQEGLVCTGPLKRAEVTPTLPVSETARLSKAHQANVRSLQKCRIPPLLHPELSGLTSPDEWRPAFFQELAGTGRPPGFTEEDQKLANRLFAEVSSEFESSSVVSNSRSGTEVEITDFDGVCATFSTCGLAELETPNFSQFESSLLERCKINDLRNLSPDNKAKLRSDMELLQWVFHRRIRHVFDCPPDAVTVLMAIPISSALAERTSHQSKLPGTFRGVIWVFAKLSSHFGPLQESLFTDLGRICWMLESESVAQEANKSLGATLARRYQGTFAHEIKDVVSAISSDSDAITLSKIREYFRLICLTPRDFDRWTLGEIWAGVRGEFPAGFAQGSTIDEFIINHFAIARMVHELPSRVNKREVIPIGPPILEIERRELFAEFRAHGATPPAKLQQLCWFSMALVSCFTNVFKKDFKGMNVMVSADGDAISVRNEKGQQIEMPRDGGTDSVLRGHVMLYSEGREDYYWFGEDPGNSTFWLTRMPLPRGFLK